MAFMKKGNFDWTVSSHKVINKKSIDKFAHQLVTENQYGWVLFRWTWLLGQLSMAFARPFKLSSWWKWKP